MANARIKGTQGKLQIISRSSLPSFLPLLRFLPPSWLLKVLFIHLHAFSLPSSLSLPLSLFRSLPLMSFVVGSFVILISTSSYNQIKIHTVSSRACVVLYNHHHLLFMDTLLMSYLICVIYKSNPMS